MTPRDYEEPLNDEEIEQFDDATLVIGSVLLCMFLVIMLVLWRLL